MEVVKYPKVGGKYQHYKGGIYEVITMATHSETSEPLVIYKSILFGSIYARPLKIWFDVILEKYPNSIIRFKEIEVF
jgi:hypothetical protein